MPFAETLLLPLRLLLIFLEAQTNVVFRPHSFFTVRTFVVCELILARLAEQGLPTLRTDKFLDWSHLVAYDARVVFIFNEGVFLGF